MTKNTTYEKDRKMILKLAEDILGSKNLKRIERMGGMTNHSYRIILDCGDYVFRIAGEGTDELIDRKAEKISTELGCSLNIDTKLLYFNEKTGAKITEYIEDAETMSKERLKDPENLKMAACLLRTLHTCGKDTHVPFRVFEIAADYENFIRKNQVCLFEDYEEKKNQVLSIKKDLDKKQTLLVPCHNDPLCENWIKGKDRMYLIDWEYAGMNDPLWDVADVSIEAALNTDEEEILLNAYFEERISSESRIRYNANKVFIDFLWSLWGLTRVPFDEGMTEYAEKRWERMKRNM